MKTDIQSFGADFTADRPLADRLRRLFDVAVAIIGLIVASPVMIVITTLLWLDAPGHALFAQQRLGRNGRLFTLYKFRKFPASWQSAGPGVTVANDSRLTRFGAILERTKFDELPQLWNILKGEMAFIGPRPESPRFGDLFTGRHRRLLDYTPGLFGPAQVAFRNESEMYPSDQDPEQFYRQQLFGQKADLDLAYYQHRNGLASDIGWMVRGIWVSAVGTVRWQRLLRQYGLLMLLDIGIVALAWALANLFRFGGWPSAGNIGSLINGVWLMPLIVVGCLIMTGCYRHPPRYFSISDGVRLIRALSFGWVLGFVLIIGLSRHTSLYLLPTSWFIVVPLLILSRIELKNRVRIDASKFIPNATGVLIFGTGTLGVALSDWLARGTRAARLIGFIDDNPEFRGQSVHGAQILGTEKDITVILQKQPVSELWLTFVPGPEKRYRLESLCEQTGVRLVVLPESEPFVRICTGGR